MIQKKKLITCLLFLTTVVTTAVTLNLVSCDKNDSDKDKSDDKNKESLKSPGAPKESLKEKDINIKNMSYAFGVFIARVVESQVNATKSIDVNIIQDDVNKGFSDFFDKKTKFSDEDIERLVSELDKLSKSKVKESQEKQKAEADKRKADKSKQNAEWIKKNNDFLTENAKKDGVKTTASGLQYKIIKEGSGAQPSSKEQTVSVKYSGSLIDGKVFDKNDNTSFALNKVVPGFSESLMMMKTGSVYEVYIPAELGYGDSSFVEAIPPGSTLIFEIELLGIEKKESNKK